MIGGYDSSSHQAPGLVRVYSGRDGTLIRTHDENQHGGFGQSIADLGDIDGDGRPDYVVGAHLARHPSSPFVPRGSAQVYSGADGTLLYTFWGAPTSSLG